MQAIYVQPVMAPSVMGGPFLLRPPSGEIKNLSKQTTSLRALILLRGGIEWQSTRQTWTPRRAVRLDASGRTSADRLSRRQRVARSSVDRLATICVRLGVLGKRFSSASKSFQKSEKISRILGTTKLSRPRRILLVDSVDAGRIHAGHSSGIRIMQTGLASLDEFTGLKAAGIDECDVVVLNHHAARGLPGTEKSSLDAWLDR